MVAHHLCSSGVDTAIVPPWSPSAQVPRQGAKEQRRRKLRFLPDRTSWQSMSREVGSEWRSIIMYPFGNIVSQRPFIQHSKRICCLLALAQKQHVHRHLRTPSRRRADPFDVWTLILQPMSGRPRTGQACSALHPVRSDEFQTVRRVNSACKSGCSGPTTFPPLLIKFRALPQLISRALLPIDCLTDCLGKGDVWPSMLQASKAYYCAAPIPWPLDEVLPVLFQHEFTWVHTCVPWRAMHQQTCHD